MRTGRLSRDELLSNAFVDLADTLVDEYDVIDLLARLVHHSVALLAADAAAIMLAGADGALQVVASSSEEAKLMELLQLEAQQGPCWECVRTGKPVSVPDLTDTERWPQFRATAAAHGAFRSVHALPLRLRRESVGALNLFHTQPGPLPDTDLALGQALADVATIGLLQERAIHQAEALAEQLQHALTSRVIIVQAKGVLAHRGDLSMDDAFGRLRDFARRHNQRLADVARQVVTGELTAAVLAPHPRHH